MIQDIKNFIGNLLGYASCNITGNTFMGDQRYVVNCSKQEGLCISGTALKLYSPQEMGKIMYEKSLGRVGKESVYPLEEITNSIKERKIIELPSKHHNL